MITVIETGDTVTRAVPIWAVVDTYHYVTDAIATGAFDDAEAVLVDRTTAGSLDRVSRYRVALVVDTVDADAEEIARRAGIDAVTTADVPAWLARTSN